MWRWSCCARGKSRREVVAGSSSRGRPSRIRLPEITLAFEPTFPDLVDSTWDITFTTPDYCRYFGWGLYRWSGAPGACCSNFDIPIALEVPGLPNGTPLPLSRSDAAPKAGKKHSIQLIDDPPYPGDLYCLYGNVVLPADDEGNLVYYPLASVVFGTNCFTGGVVREVIETDDGYEYMVQSAARAENGHALDVLRVRPSDNRRYNVGEWVTIHVDSAQCRHARPGIDTVWVVADDTPRRARAQLCPFPCSRTASPFAAASITEFGAAPCTRRVTRDDIRSTAPRSRVATVPGAFAGGRREVSTTASDNDVLVRCQLCRRPFAFEPMISCGCCMSAAAVRDRGRDCRCLKSSVADASPPCVKQFPCSTVRGGEMRPSIYGVRCRSSARRRPTKGLRASPTHGDV